MNSYTLPSSSMSVIAPTPAAGASGAKGSAGSGEPTPAFAHMLDRAHASPEPTRPAAQTGPGSSPAPGASTPTSGGDTAPVDDGTSAQPTSATPTPGDEGGQPGSIKPDTAGTDLPPSNTSTPRPPSPWHPAHAAALNAALQGRARQAGLGEGADAAPAGGAADAVEAALRDAGLGGDRRADAAASGDALADASALLAADPTLAGATPLPAADPTLDANALLMSLSARGLGAATAPAAGEAAASADSSLESRTSVTAASAALAGAGAPGDVRGDPSARTGATRGAPTSPALNAGTQLSDGAQAGPLQATGLAADAAAHTPSQPAGIDDGDRLGDGAALRTLSAGAGAAATTAASGTARGSASDAAGAHAAAGTAGHDRAARAAANPTAIRPSANGANGANGADAADGAAAAAHGAGTESRAAAADAHPATLRQAAADGSRSDRTSSASSAASSATPASGAAARDGLLAARGEGRGNGASDDSGDRSGRGNRQADASERLQTRLSTHGETAALAPAAAAALRAESLSTTETLGTRSADRGAEGASSRIAAGDAVATPGTLAWVAPAAAQTVHDTTSTDGRIAASPGNADFAPQLAAHVTTLVRDGLQQARLELNPTEMGPLTVQIQLEGNNARVHLAAENAQTRQALEQAMPQLAGSLRDSGLTLSGGGVFEQPRQQQPQQQSGQANGNGNGNGNGRGRDDGLTEPRSISVGATTGPQARRRAGVVDLVA